jgi:hypothetical protein
MTNMQVSQVAYDRFVLELPPADATWRPLADPECLAETAAWLWDFGPKPLIAVIGVDRAAPSWLAAWKSRGVRFAPGGASSGVAVILANRTDLERFLSEGAPHERTVLLWPRVSEVKTFEALNGAANAWLKTVDGQATIQRGGEVYEVHSVVG